ncbi:MAG TPA: OmpA family protein [Phenylobacterium sp.]|nr:OmpA family protein [Phenylobacterium sp.]
MRVVLSGVAALLMLTSAPVCLAQPAPQFSVDDLETNLGRSSSPAPAAAASTGSCEAQGMTTGPDGVCEPRMAGKRGFSLSAPEPVRPAARPAAAPARRAPPPRRVASRTPAPSAAPAPVRPAQRGFDLLITFENDSNQLTEQAQANVKVFADALQRRPLRTARFAIEGHTDAVGSRAYNQNLSEQRANAVVDFLVREGVDRSRFTVRGFGFSQPIADDPRSAENRRVEARRLS